MREDYVEAGGFRVRYWEAGRGGTAVILGGLPWRLTRLQEALAQNYRVVGFELPGMGDSEANTQSTSLEGLAESMSQVVAAVVGGAYTLIGASFGGSVALWQALQAADQVEALVMISPTALLAQDNSTASTPAEIAASMLAHPENIANLPPLDLDTLAKEQALAARLTSASQSRASASRLPEVRCPTLAVFGQEDRLVSPEAARIYREKIPNCNVSLVYDAGHAIEAERPQALINLVSDYVERRETFIVNNSSQIINP